MKPLLFTLLVLSAALELNACGTTAHCQRPQDYQSAQDRAPVVGPDGQPLPESASALRIPPPVENPVAFGEKGPGESWSCLDIPPRMEEKPKS